MPIYQTSVTRERESDTPPIPSTHSSTMRAAAVNAANTPSTTAYVGPPTIPVAPNGRHEHGNIPDRWPTNPPVSTRDFHLDTFFNPVWMAGPDVFSFANDGTVVRPKTYAPEPYPGYQADRNRHLESAGASHSQGFAKKDPKPWKNVAITEQDDAEYEAFLERMRVVGGWRPH